MTDLIDRQAAIDAIWSHATKILENSDYDLFIQDIYKMTHRHIAELIEQIPSAQPDRKVGKWIDHSDDGYVECPFCRSATNCDDNINELHYCFSCGAKMEVEE